ncbi:MAG: hypothetical protein WDO73_04545 [Ignavibacteriota bacterium]
MEGLNGIFDEPAMEVFREEIAKLSEDPTSFQSELVARTLKGRSAWST